MYWGMPVTEEYIPAPPKTFCSTCAVGSHEGTCWFCGAAYDRWGHGTPSFKGVLLDDLGLESSSSSDQAGS